ncbi:CCAAT-binding transcription factor (CBF-B/NF-YA) subunit B-domain-containing protein [Xylogone sp. PMI_703]|nr:CCAAT-binding transcription factor (CBF-B/NF-YA) subunit B-domain-containing protein [Xylogone sp. PMI_703]
MEYAQYQQPAQSQHGHTQGHLQGGYPNSGQHPGAGPSITSPAQQPLHSQHQVHTQASPILPPGQQQAPQNQGHAIHQPMNYQTTYVPQGGMHYGMPEMRQAAAMAATAAASGQAYPYGMPDSGLPQTSPRMAGMPVKKETRPGPRSPTQVNNQIGHQLPQVPQGRRMSQQVASPAVPTTQQPNMNHRGPAASVMPPMPPTQQVPHPQSPELVSGAVEESPLYVNAKQFHRILKRRVARQRLEEALRLTSKGRKPYLHESRHNHAMRRPRGPGGRFLTADEVAEIERNKAAEAANNGAGAGNGEGGDAKADSETPNKATAPTSQGSGMKRKAESDNTTPSKKTKTDSNSAEDEDEEEDDGEDDG